MTLDSVSTLGLYPQNMHLEPTRTSEIDPQMEACLHLVQESEEAGQRAEAATNRLFEKMKQTIKEQETALKNAEECKILDANRIKVLEKKKEDLEKALSDEKERNKSREQMLQSQLQNLNSKLSVAKQESEMYKGSLKVIKEAYDKIQNRPKPIYPMSECMKLHNNLKAACETQFLHLHL